MLVEAADGDSGYLYLVRADGRSAAVAIAAVVRGSVRLRDPDRGVVDELARCLVDAGDVSVV